MIPEGFIVEAVYRPDIGAALTGLVCDVWPDAWATLDALEGAYDRVGVTTTDGQAVWMYIAR